jgi:caffeoyl-CoA O-methyltransferase
MLTLVDRKIEDYAISKSEPTSDLLKDVIEKTFAGTELPQMLAGPIEGRFLKMMVQTVGARRVLELGTFTGYSALCLAEGLPADGELYTCELDPKHIGMAKEFFARSEHASKIKLLEGKALDSIKQLKAPFDLVFIDADKTNYPNYYEAVMPLLRSGGVILVDNVLWSGKVLDPKTEDDLAIAKLNDRIASDERVDRVLLPIRDGIFFVRKR